MSNNLMAAHRQWAERPADERFWNLHDLLANLEARTKNTFTHTPLMNDLTAVAVKDDLCIQGRAGNPVQLSNWAYGQLCNRVNAPASYLNTLPANMAAGLLNYGFKKADKEQPAQILLYRNGASIIRAVTTDYDRLWNRDIVRAILPNLSNGWMTPPARPAPGVNDPRARPATADDIVPNQDDFGLSVKVGDMIAPAGVYEGDRDMFLFLVNPTRIIDDGGKGLMRGVFVWNSEVGAGSAKFKTFMLENVCGNHICWGASKVSEFRAVHRGDNIKKFNGKVLEAIKAATPKDLRAEEKMIAAARKQILGKGKEETIETVYGRKALNIARRDVEAAWEWATRYEHTAKAAPDTVWGFVHGLTRYSQTMTHTDARHKLDTIGGKILDWVTVA